MSERDDPYLKITELAPQLALILDTCDTRDGRLTIEKFQGRWYVSADSFGSATFVVRDDLHDAIKHTAKKLG